MAYFGVAGRLARSFHVCVVMDKHPVGDSWMEFLGADFTKNLSRVFKCSINKTKITHFTLD